MAIAKVQQPSRREFGYLVLLGYPNINRTQSQILESRLRLALMLFREGRARRIVVTGKARSTVGGRMESEIMRDYLVDHGVGRRSILMERHSMNTIGNAFFTKLLIGRQESLLVVTSDFHVPRARYIFNKIFGRKCRIEVEGSPTDKRIYARAVGFEKASFNHVRSRLRGINERSSKEVVLKRLGEIKKSPMTPEMREKAWY